MTHNTTESHAKTRVAFLSILRAVLVLILLLAWAALAHITSSENHQLNWAAIPPLIPMMLAMIFALKHFHRVITLGAVMLFATSVFIAWPFLGKNTAFLYYLDHLGAYCFLAVLFGRSLRGPQESLVTQMARRVHRGVLSEAQAIYTRKVTAAWTLFFASMAATSSVLFLIAPVHVWSLFANLLGGPLIALMFLAEYGWRRHALKEENKASIMDAIKAWRTQDFDKPA